VTLATACEIDFEESRIVRAILKGREVLLGAKPVGTTLPRGLLAKTKALGWGTGRSSWPGDCDGRGNAALGGERGFSRTRARGIRFISRPGIRQDRMDTSRRPRYSDDVHFPHGDARARVRPVGAIEVPEIL